MRIIGFMGKMGVGKSTVANQLRVELEAHGEQSVVMSFGTPLKEDVDAQFMAHPEYSHLVGSAYTIDGKTEELGVTRGEFAGWFGINYLRADAALVLKTVRAALQFYGTDLRRAEDSDYWVRRAREKWEQIARVQGRTIIIDDIRTPNEAYSVKQFAKNNYCDYALHYIRPYPSYCIKDNHASEQAFSEQFITDYTKMWTVDYGQLPNITYGILMDSIQ